MPTVAPSVVVLSGPRHPARGAGRQPYDDAMADTGERLAAYTVVAAQFALFGVILAPRRGARPPAPTRVAAGVAIGAGAVVAAAGMSGLGRDLTPLPLPPADGRLRTGGVYAVVRHPVYTGVMVASLARGVQTGGRLRPAAAAALCALLAVKARWEERRLADRFPEYDAYARRTPRFVPALRRGPAPAGGAGR